MEHWELVAREAIRELVARYAHHADRGRFDELVALFTGDGVLEIDDRPPLRGHDAIRSFLVGTQADLRRSPARGVIRHHVTSPAIEVAGPVDASGAAYFLVIGPAGPDHWGRYRDRYRCADGVWRFAGRRVLVEGFAPGSWAAARRSAD